MAGEFCVCVPDCVPTVVGALVLTEKPVLLDAVGIGIKNVGMAAIVKGIQKHADLVVIINQLATQHAGADFAGLIIEGQKNCEEAFVRITEISFRALRNR